MDDSQDRHSQQQSLHHSRQDSKRSSQDSASQITAKEYFQQLQKILNEQNQSQSTSGIASPNNGNNYQLGTLTNPSAQKTGNGSTSKDISQYSPQDNDLLRKDYDALDNKKRSLLNKPPSASSGSGIVVQNELLFDISKLSTSPPSSNQPLSHKNSESFNLNLVASLSSQSTQSLQLLDKLEQSLLSKNNSNSNEAVQQLKQVLGTIKDQLGQLHKQEQAKASEKEKLLNLMKEKEQEVFIQDQVRLKIQGELDQQDSSKLLKSELTSFFGSPSAFTKALQCDQYQVFQFLKQVQITPKEQKVPNSVIMNQILSQQQPSQPPSHNLRRKKSDPQFDNEEYLKQIEEKYMQQFEQSLIAQITADEKKASKSSKESIKDAINTQLGKDALKASINKTEQRQQAQQNKGQKKKKKRLGSDDKFDKKDYQERMEKQILQMIKKSFPVESSSSGGDSENVTDENPTDYELSFKRKSEGENGINDSVKEDKVAVEIKKHQKQRSSLMLDMMPDEVARQVNNLCDSKDQLEDPNDINNFFEITGMAHPQNTERSQKSSLLSQDMLMVSVGGLSGGGGLETPAFGKKKNPSLAFFKGESQTLDTLESNKKNGSSTKAQTGTKVRDQHSYDIKPQNQAYTYDNWKKEVKKIFQKKSPTSSSSKQQQLPHSGVALTNIQSSLSPQSKKGKSPSYKSKDTSLFNNNGTTGGSSRNQRLDSSLSMGNNVSKERSYGIIGSGQMNRPLTSVAMLHSEGTIDKIQSSKAVKAGHKSPTSMTVGIIMAGGGIVGTQQATNNTSVKAKISTFRSKEESKTSLVKQQMAATGTSNPSSRNQRQQNIPKVLTLQNQTKQAQLDLLYPVNSIQPPSSSSVSTNVGGTTNAKDLKIDLGVIDSYAQAQALLQGVGTVQSKNTVSSTKEKGGGGTSMKSRNQGNSTSKSPSMR